jgi:hypothetical protein
MAAETILVKRLGIFGLLFLLLPFTVIADTFTYNLAVDSFTPPPSGPPGPTLNPWSANFQESLLLNWAVGGSIPSVDLTTSGAPAATYFLFAIFFGRTGSGIDETTAEWRSPNPSLPQLFYTAHFSAVTPPEMTGIFPPTDTLVEDTDGFQPGPSTTLTITQVAPEPSSIMLTLTGLLGLAVISRNCRTSSGKAKGEIMNVLSNRFALPFRST